MKLREKDIIDYFPTQIFNRGRNYANARRVKNLKVTEEDDHVSLCSQVVGTETYTVTLTVEKHSMMGHCDCPHFARGGTCKHMAATLVTYLDQYGTPPAPSVSTQRKKAVRRDDNASFLLESYLCREESHTEALPSISLVPQLLNAWKGYPSIGFTIGHEKRYVVRNIENLLRDISEHRTVSYGKALSFCHDMDRFDEQSQALLRILFNEFPLYKSLYRGVCYSYSPPSLTHNKRGICLEGDSFYQFVQLMMGQSIVTSDWKEPIPVEMADPPLSIHLTATKEGAIFELDKPDELTFFGNTFQLYAISKKGLYCCSQAFTQKAYPLTTLQRDSLRFQQDELSTLCSVVLSEVEGLVAVVDEDGIVAQYIPDPCVPQFYFDEDSIWGLSCQLKYQYGDVILTLDSPIPEGIKCNTKVQHAAQALVKQKLGWLPGRKCYVLAEEDGAVEFLTTELAPFQTMGEVYLSERLQKKRISTEKRPSVGVSVSDGILSLDIDTGEFPAEELEGLYDSLLKRKRYHKLADGRYLPLDGSGYEKVAEIVHMTQLTPKDLAQGTVTLPAFRGLYLDQVLEGNEGVDLWRNGTFRRMLRDFKSLSESDHQPPDTLQATLRPYQVVGFQWMKTLEQHGFGGILADEMGLGKTVQVITYLLTATRQERDAPSLIICPASLILNWGEELARFAPSLHVLSLMGTAKERREQMECEEAQRADVWVTSYDLLKRDITLYQDKSFYTVVLDEGQNIKNQSTLVSKAVKKLNCKQRFVLTGTPVENRLSELWNLYDFLMPGYLFSHNAFVKKLEKPIVKSGDQEARRQLNRLVSPFLLRRLKGAVLKDLPPKMEYVRKILQSEMERKVYLAAAQKAKQQALESQSKLQILALLTHLRQICCDPALCFEGYEGESSKLEACMELCQSMAENGHQILLFSQFTGMLDRIGQSLDKLGISHFTLQGSTPKEKRAQLVKDFGAGKATVFLISLKAGGTGLNLTSADVVIHYDPWWNQAAQNQATDRAHRIGQSSHVQVYKLIAQGTLEEKILALQEKKASLLDAVTQESDGSPLSKEDILALLD